MVQSRLYTGQVSHRKHLQVQTRESSWCHDKAVAHEIKHVGKSKYISMELGDGEKNVHFVGFDSKFHDEMSRIHEKKEAISVSNCSQGKEVLQQA